MAITPDLLVRLQYLQLLEVAVVVHHQQTENLADLVVVVLIQVLLVVLRLLELAVILVDPLHLVVVLLMDQVVAVAPVELELMVLLLKAEMVDWEDKFHQPSEIQILSLH
tara:strand:- start:329 stop:658 length:330 start_codon:yes stop_codon:yes gene_type:complete